MMNGNTDRRFYVAVGRALGTVVVTVHGNIDVEGCHVLHRLVRDLVEDQGNLDVVLDLWDVDDIDPSQVAWLANSLGPPARPGRYRLARPSPALREALAAVPDSGSAIPFDTGGVPTE